MASSTAFSHQQHDQLQSPLFRLPPELRNQIFSLSMLTSSPIIDPVAPTDTITAYGRPQTCYHHLPLLGTSLLSTCQRAYLESPSPLLLSNDISFTSPSHVTSFASTLPPSTAIKCLTISLRQTNLFQCSSDGTPSAPLAIHWLHFLTCPHPSIHPPTIWCSKLPTLWSVFPHLERLTFDLTGLAANRPSSGGVKSGPARALAALIRGLRRPEGLREISVRGGGKQIWDLGDVSRPGPCGEWIAVDAWTALVGGEVVAALNKSLGTEEEVWTGVVQKIGGQFEIVARRGELSEREAREQGVVDATSWEEVCRLTATRDRYGHPAFNLFD